MKIRLTVDTNNVSEIKEALTLLGGLGTEAPKLAAAGRKAAPARKALAKIAEEAEKNSISEDQSTHTIGDAQTLVSEKVAEHRVEIRAKMKALGVDKVSKFKGEFKARLPEFIEFLKGLK